MSDRNNVEEYERVHGPWPTPAEPATQAGRALLDTERSDHTERLRLILAIEAEAAQDATEPSAVEALDREDLLALRSAVDVVIGQTPNGHITSRALDRASGRIDALLTREAPPAREREPRTAAGRALLDPATWQRVGRQTATARATILAIEAEAVKPWRAALEEIDFALKTDGPLPMAQARALLGDGKRDG